MLQASGALASGREGHKCPACGKAVDSLRAGYVAIQGGRFQYFCDEQCKHELIAQSSGPLPSEVVTLEPPPVFDSVVPEAESSVPLASVPISATRRVSAPLWPPAETRADDPPATLPSAFSRAPEAPVRVQTLPSIDDPREVAPRASRESAAVRPAPRRVPPWVVGCG